MCDELAVDFHMGDSRWGVTVNFIAEIRAYPHLALHQINQHAKNNMDLQFRANF